jgi:anti-sigma B factor antagonist
MIDNQAMQDFHVRVSHEGAIHVVAISGSLADENNTKAKEVFLAVLDEQPTRLVVDLEGMDYISSAGIGLLVSILRRCRQRGIAMPVAGLRPDILELFRLTRLTEVFEIYETSTSALHGR